MLKYYKSSNISRTWVGNKNQLLIIGSCKKHMHHDQGNFAHV